MGEPIAEVGYLAGICAHDGADWQKLKVDANGRLEVSVAAGHKYIDRGDPAAHDFDQTDLDMDNAWYLLDLSDIVLDSDAVLVHLLIFIKDSVAGLSLHIREHDNSNGINIAAIATQVANVWICGECQVSIDSFRLIAYKVSGPADGIYITVRGWWRPAA